MHFLPVFLLCFFSFVHTSIFPYCVIICFLYQYFYLYTYILPCALPVFSHAVFNFVYFTIISITVSCSNLQGCLYFSFLTSMLLRSGNSYLAKMSLPTTATDITFTTTDTTTMTSTTATLASTVSSIATGTSPIISLPTSSPGSVTIKLLHQDPSIKKFSGDDVAYTALQFLQACEDQMVNTNITTGADKISFVRSQLVSDSLASDMMLAHAFDPKALNYDFSQFRKNFLEAFDSAQQQGSFQWIFQLADTLPSALSSLGRMRGQPRAAMLATEAVNSLQASSCIQNNQISVEHVRSLLEFQYFVMFLTPQERRAASSLDYKPGDSVLNFASKIHQKLKVMPPSLQTVASVSKEASASAKPATSISNSSTSARSSITYACTYCNKAGHTWERCFRRLRSARKSSPATSSSHLSYDDSFETLPFSSQGQVATQRSRFSRASSRSPARSMTVPSNRPRSCSRNGQGYSHMNLERPPFTCLIHGPSGHPTEECRVILRLQKQQTVTASPPQSNFYQRHHNNDAG